MEGGKLADEPLARMKAAAHLRLRPSSLALSCCWCLSRLQADFHFRFSIQLRVNCGHVKALMDVRPFRHALGAWVETQEKLGKARLPVCEQRYLVFRAPPLLPEVAMREPCHGPPVQY